METFKEQVKIHVKQHIQHKWGFLFTLFVQPFILLVNYYIFTSIYQYNGTAEVKGYGVSQMIWYFTAVHFVSVFIWNNTHYNISSKVLSGDITIDLLKPVSLYKLELADAVGLRIVGVLLEFIPAVFIYSMIVFPEFITWKSIIQFFVTAVLSFFLYYNIGYLVGMLSFSLKRSGTVNAVKDVLVNIMGGVLIPLEFYPQAFAKILDYLPFKYIFYWPVQFFLNRFPDDGMLFGRVIGLQTVWIIVFYVIDKLVTTLMLRRYCAAGG